MCPRIALRIAYDGGCFSGFQRQPGKRTVEAALLSALREIGAICNPRSANYRASSRTDKGVSALGNVISIDTEFDVDRLPKAVNSKAEDIWCTGIAALPDDFNVRFAHSRTYACYLQNEGQDIVNMQNAAKELLGRHDFSRYARIDNRDPQRTIRHIEIVKNDDIIELIIEGDSFLWNQVRRMAWILDQVGKGSIDSNSIAPENFGLKRVGLIPAESLLLLSVDIGHDFKLPRYDDQSMAELSNRLLSARVRSRFFDAILSNIPGQ